MTTTAPAKKAKLINITSFDYVEGQLLGEFNRYTHDVDHYAEMEKLARTEKGKNRWRFCRRRYQKLKDDILAILYRYQERRSLRDLAAAFHDAKEERRAQIDWLAGRPQEDPEHTEKAKDEIYMLHEFLTVLLHHVKDANPGREIASEAAYVLAISRL